MFHVLAETDVMHTMRLFKTLWFFLVCHVSLPVTSEFVINAKNDDGNVVKEVIQEHMEGSYITLEYTDWDLTKITHLIDSKSGFSIYRVILYGELDIDQPLIETLCFVNHVAPTEFIEPDSVSKLRQVCRSMYSILIQIIVSHSMI